MRALQPRFSIAQRYRARVFAHRHFFLFASSLFLILPLLSILWGGGTQIMVSTVGLLTPRGLEQLVVNSVSHGLDLMII